MGSNRRYMVYSLRRLRYLTVRKDCYVAAKELVGEQTQEKTQTAGTTLE